MVDIDSIKASLQDFKNQLVEKMAEKQSYLDTAAQIDIIYDRMLNDKEIIEGYKKSVKSFSKEKLDTFSGNLYVDTYKTQLKALIKDYDLVIKNIDINLDRLNTAKAQYENKAYNCNGPIGYLESSINSLVHTIENLIN